MRRTWAVARAYDDGRPPVLIQRNLTADEAAREAGHWRDAMPEHVVAIALAEWWNYLPVNCKPARKETTPGTPAVQSDQKT